MSINNYVIATEPLGEKKARNIIKNNYAVCDTRFILDYYRFSEDWRLIFGAGETFSPIFMHDSKKFVMKRMIKVFPMLKHIKIDYSWGGTLAITTNRLPHFGELLNNKLKLPILFLFALQKNYFWNFVHTDCSGINLFSVKRRTISSGDSTAWHADILCSEKRPCQNERFNCWRSINHSFILWSVIFIKSIRGRACL